MVKRCGTELMRPVSKHSADLLGVDLAFETGTWDDTTQRMDSSNEVHASSPLDQTMDTDDY